MSAIPAETQPCGRCGVLHHHFVPANQLGDPACGRCRRVHKGYEAPDGHPWKPPDTPADTAPARARDRYRHWTWADIASYGLVTCECGAWFVAAPDELRTHDHWHAREGSGRG